MIERLEGLAKELQELQTNVQDFLQNLYQGDWQVFPDNEKSEQLIKVPLEITLERNEQLLEKIREELYSLLSTGQIRIGLNYASHLHAVNEETRFIVNYIFNNINDENRKVIVAVNDIFKLISLQNKHTISVRKSRRALFLAAKSTSEVLRQCKKNEQSISKFHHQIASCLETLIARIGTQILNKSTNDDNTWLNIVSGKYQPDDIHITGYIEKEIIKWLYFSQAPSPIELDTVLYFINKNQSYQEYINKKLESRNSLFKLYKSYSPTNNEETIQKNLNDVITIRELTDDKFDNGII